MTSISDIIGHESWSNELKIIQLLYLFSGFIHHNTIVWFECEMSLSLADQVKLLLLAVMLVMFGYNILDKFLLKWDQWNSSLLMRKDEVLSLFEIVLHPVAMVAASNLTVWVSVTLLTIVFVSLRVCLDVIHYCLYRMLDCFLRDSPICLYLLRGDGKASMFKRLGCDSYREIWSCEIHLGDIAVIRCLAFGYFSHPSVSLQ